MPSARTRRATTVRGAAPKGYHWVKQLTNPPKWRLVRNSGGVTRRFRGGGVKEDATAYLKKNGIDGIALLFEVNARKPNGSRAVSTKTMGGFTFKGDGHPAQSMYLMVKKEGDANSAYVNTGITYSDH